MQATGLHSRGEAHITGEANPLGRVQLRPREREGGNVGESPRRKAVKEKLHGGLC